MMEERRANAEPDGGDAGGPKGDGGVNRRRWV